MIAYLITSINIYPLFINLNQHMKVVNRMWNFIKGLFKFVFGTILTVSLAAGIGAVVFAYIFKKDFEDIDMNSIKNCR
jgi:hypothetical protein